ncbi:DNA primase [Bosea sp. LC85]|uniref:DUF7146 domain-containing protein n=1 Tax=Bosea sp. LC85 TaxID=1502851 RepID=UPI0004E2CCB6|nr:hypothetical protein [Bosea sp. LC85]KFC73214.1 DNA primase [Bosea sp. LC85]
MSLLPDPAFEAWLDKAKGVSVLNAALKLGFAPKGGTDKATDRARGDISGPCPRCRGVDRFSVKPSESMWFCRGEGRGGYDAISLVRYVQNCSFLVAVEWLTGEPKPGRTAKVETPDEKAAREAERQRLQDESDKARADGERLNNQFREDERRRCREIWRNGKPASGSLVERYLQHRGIPAVPAGAKLRFHPEIHLRHPPGKGGEIVHTGPAMLSPIADNDSRFGGLHMTWLDPRLANGTAPAGEKGKLKFVVAGEALAVKRSRGSKNGGHLILVPAPSGRVSRIVIGEGIETVLSVWATLLEAGEELSETEFWSSVDLPNLGGKAVNSVPHPTRKQTDRRGRVYAPRVPGPVPDQGDPARSIALPDTVIDVLILADGDSDRFTVECAVARASARWAMPGRTVRVVWPDDGSDFNDMRMRRVRAR